MRGDGASECLGMGDDGSEVLDADDNVYILLHVEVFKVFCVDGDRCFEWLLQHLYLLRQ